MVHEIKNSLKNHLNHEPRINLTLLNLLNWKDGRIRRKNHESWTITLWSFKIAMKNGWTWPMYRWFIYIYIYRYYTPIRYGDLQPNCPKWMVLFCGDVTSQNCVARCLKQQTWWFNEKSIGVRWGYIWMNLMMTSRRDGNWMMKIGLRQRS